MSRSEGAVRGRPLIEMQPEREFYPLAQAQKYLLMIEELKPGKINHNMPVKVVIDEQVDRKRLANCFKSLIARHDALRTSVHFFNGEWVQQVHATVNFLMDYLEVPEEEVQQSIATFIRPFNLSKAPLFRARLLCCAPVRNILVLDMHQIICDGVSQQILLNDLFKLYRGEPLATQHVQYKDYVLWEKKWSETAEFAEQTANWLESFDQESRLVTWPANCACRVDTGLMRERMGFDLSLNQIWGLNYLAQGNGVAVYAVLLAIFQVLLCKYCQKNDIAIGLVVSRRPGVEVADVVGNFQSTLVWQATLEPGKAFKTLLAEINAGVLAQEERLEWGRDVLVDGLVLTGALSMERVELQFEYQTGLFTHAAAERIAGHLRQILRQVVRDTELRIEQIELVSPEEREQILQHFNAPGLVYSPHRTFVELFADQAIRNPARLAVVSGPNQLTYSELDTQTNQLARTLCAKGVGPEEIVAVVADNSLDMVIAILAILKAGAAFLIIDINNPATRIKFMLKDSRAKYLLTQSNFLYQLNLEEFIGEIVCLDGSRVYQGDSTPLKCVNLPEDLAYVVYTPGTQSQANGVIVEHRALTNLIAWYIESFEVTACSRYGKYAALSCDASIWEIFPCLAAGGVLHLIDGAHYCSRPALTADRLHSMMRKLNEYFEANGVTHTYLPSGFAEEFVGEANQSLQYFLLDSGCQLEGIDQSSTGFSGEGVSRGYQLVKIFELAEALICASHRLGSDAPGDDNALTVGWFKAAPAGAVIGRPINNVRIFIVDAAGHLQPVGVAGEICIAGDCLALGYLNRLELTSCKFVFNHFDGSGRILKTGEYGKWLPDGNIVHLGRRDRQVKIFGYRVEPGEIESYLWRHPEINSVSVTTRLNAQGVRYLVAHYSAAREIFAAELRAYLEKRLPEYMVPTQLIQVSDLQNHELIVLNQ